jgi:ATP synthase protein I
VAHDSTDDAGAPLREDPALGSLESRLSAARRAEDARLAREHAPMAQANVGWSAVSTMVGYPLGGIVIGFAIDRWLDTTPWVMIGLMFTAFFGALLQVVRSNQKK